MDPDIVLNPLEVALLTEASPFLWRDAVERPRDEVAVEGHTGTGDAPSPGGG
ncbi:MAG: hypothetical protein PHG20_13145 [Geobacteraceae bacterium]|nr:hypothetical protein [Geobacteraceae bacterium]